MSGHFDETGEFPMPFALHEYSELSVPCIDIDEGDDGNGIDSGDEA